MQAVDTAPQAPSAKPVALPLRDDTMLGVCAGLGEEFGLNPNILRVLLGVIVLFDIKIAVVTYLGLGLALALGRLLFPPRQPVLAEPLARQPVVESNDSGAAPETLAA